MSDTREVSDFNATCVFGGIGLTRLERAG